MRTQRERKLQSGRIHYLQFTIGFAHAQIPYINGINCGISIPFSSVVSRYTEFSQPTKIYSVKPSILLDYSWKQLFDATDMETP